MPPFVALVDCANFYVSCERLFRPDLAGRPVAVLSNNDGCVIARSDEVKALGVRMGAPFFEVRERLAAAGAVVFSSNYELYADLSRRVLEVLGTFADDVEAYSIDEAFLALPALRPEELPALAAAIHERVLRWTGIPVRVGVAETKTLAKVAGEHAKRAGRRGGVPAFCLPGRSAAERDALLAAVPVQAVWGIGRAHGRRLPKRGITTALGLRDAADVWVMRHLRTPGLRTVRELRGQPCLTLETAPAPRKSLVRSRSFGHPVTEKQALREALATHAARAAEKLRAEGLTAAVLGAFLSTGHAQARGPHRSVSATIPLPFPTNHTPDLIRAAALLLERLYAPAAPHGRPFPYRKAGVYALDLAPAAARQHALFDAPDETRDDLMDAVDRLNRRFGRHRVRWAAEGLGRHRTETGQAWAMRRQMKSPSYTTRWDELPVVRCA